MAWPTLGATTARQRAPARANDRRTVCIVDDDHSLLRALQRLISTAGFNAETFTSAEAFLDSAWRTGCGCLVLDVHLGGLSGFELNERLVANGVSIPVIFITAHDDAVTRKRAQAARAVAYLPKPFDDHLLLDAIRRVT